MKVQLYTKLSHLAERLAEYDFTVHLIESVFQIADEAIVMSDPEGALELLSHLPETKVLVLSDAPSYIEGSKLLSHGIRGYANTYIHQAHLQQALTAIESGNVWLYPEFMQELIRNATGSVKSNEAILQKLTERERETAQLVKEGLSNKEIASRLQITERTVKQHMSHIFEKLNVTDRLSLAMLLS